MAVAHPAHACRYYDTEPRLETSGARHWISRGTNFVVVATRAEAGAVLERADNADESMVLLPIGMAATVVAGGEAIQSPGDALFIVPPGSSSVHVESTGWLYRIFSQSADDLTAQADNAARFATRDEHVAPARYWPEPQGGFRLRCYRLKDYMRSDTPMRLFRSTNLMINIFHRRDTPRDPRQLSPHAHSDIEQGSLALAGDYIHHMRYPWSPDATTWRDDEHWEVSSPSLMIIPPTIIHTSQAVGAASSQLVDIFSPPRIDFSLKPGLVCNADEYPMPPEYAGQGE